MNSKANTGMLERFFKLNENKTNVKTEVLAGITTFMTMAYIIIVNPQFLEIAGMPFKEVLAATCLAAGFTTILMAFLANYPFALAPGMGLNAFFAFVVAAKYGWELALTAVFVEGLIFILMSFFKVREAIIDAIPLNLKYAVSAGIGLFIAFIGFNNAGIVVQGQGTPLALGDMSSPTVIVALIGLLVTGFLLHKNVKGALFIGIIISTIIGIFAGITSLPDKIFDFAPSISTIAFAPFRIGWDKVLTIDFVIVIFTFLFVDVFDTVGTLIGVSSKANMLDKNGKLPRASKALLTDAIGTTGGALLGTSTVTTYVESAAGVAEGGKTGLTALVTGLLFLLSLLFAPVFLIIPGAATAPALILVGLFMLEPILKINLKDYTESIPAFLTIILMPLTYSIAEGIVFGMLSYTILKVLAGKIKEVSWVMIVLSVIFVLKFFV